MNEFWSPSVWGGTNVIAVLLVSLLAASLLKKAIKQLRNSLMPTAVLGGLILLVISETYKLFSGVSMFETAFMGGDGYTILEIITYHALALGFIASTFEGANETFSKQRKTEIFNTGVTTVATYLIQANPTFNVNVKDSVLTTGTKLIIAAPNSNVVIDNSVVTLATYFRNSGNLTLKNGSVLTGATIHFGENGGNDGITTVDNSTLNIAASSAGHALDGKGTGSIVAKNGATVSVTYYKGIAIELDETSTFTGTEVK